MYNCAMENVEKNKLIQNLNKYIYNTILTLLIFILFVFCEYSNVNENYELFINDSKVKLENGIYVSNAEQYIHIEDLTKVFADNIYYDKISGKLIITTYDKLEKIEVNDTEYFIKVGNDKYVNISRIMTNLDYDTVVVNGKIYILDKISVEGKIINNRTEIYDVTNNDILDHLTKNSLVRVLVNETLKDERKETVAVRVKLNNIEYYGYVLKQNIQYEYEDSYSKNENKKVVLVRADEKVLASTDTDSIDMVTINMYRLSNANTLTKLDYINNVPKSVQVLATINNGQKSANYDQEIVSSMLNSETNRSEIIKQIQNNVATLSGVNLEFGSLKISDKQVYTQFIKELAAILHGNNQKLIVNVPSTKYIEIKEVAKFADYLVIQLYGERTLAAKTSGPISSINYVENSLKEIMSQNIDTAKVIIEIPMYTVLWTERRGTVINAEQYTMKTMTDYLKENKLDFKLDGVAGQNYMYYTKGITTYKMWLEDEYSIAEKAKLVQKYNLAGISLYKSGMELKTIYNNIEEILNK